MKYQEQYPINATQQGDTTKDAVLKNREEIKYLGDQILLRANGSGGIERQRVLYGKTLNGSYNYLSGDGLSVVIDGSTIPVIVTFADGFDNLGTKDYVETIVTKQSAWSLPANTTSYLYIERSDSGALSFGSTTIIPEYGQTLTGTETDKHIFNTIEQKMYSYNGTEWKACLRVFVAAVTTNSTTVDSIKYLANDFFTNYTNFKYMIDGLLSGNYHAMYPVGHIITSINSANPNTYLPYMSDTTWTQVGAGRVLQAVSSSQTAGSTLNAGLPNITGTFSTTPAVIGGYDIATGALKRTTQNALTSEGYTKGGTFSPLGDVVLTFNAANSNSIYGASSTVQPPALLVYFWERTA